MSLIAVPEHPAVPRVRSSDRRGAAVRVLVTMALVLAALLASAPSASAAVAGCKSDYFRQTWGGAGVTTYSYRLNVRWCWTSGGTVYNITGSGSADANLTWQVANPTGPTNSSMVPISSSSRYANQATVYGWFQSRNCATGSIGWFCSGWSWHKLVVTLKPDGRYSWYSAY